jgi:hypothetical protein
MWNKKLIYRILLFLVIMLPNIITLLSRFWFEIDRSLFIYEYLFVFLLMSFRIHYFYSWAFFVSVFFVDLATIFSKLYLFSLSDFLKSLKYLFNYSFNINQLTLLLILFFGLIGLFYLFRFIKIKTGNDKSSIYFFLFIFTFTFTLTLDTINGSSFLMSYNFNTNFYKGNFAGASTRTIYNLITVDNFSTNEAITNPLNKKSITFKQFAIDTTNSQLLIIVESMGLIDDTIKRKTYQQSISEIFHQKHWKTSWGKTQFKGSTTSAELRELLNCTGGYQNFINPKSTNNIYSIFRIKNKQGFHTNAIHSYKGDMFQRNQWWKNIGIEDVYFRENIQALYNYKLKLYRGTSFISLNDEDAFNFIQAKATKQGKQFSYLLTVNSHLPFMLNVEKPISSYLFDIDNEMNLSVEAKNQHKKISNFLIHIASHLDSSKFQSILIVGDHMPPFVKKDDRSFYNNQYVPFCIVTK